jgi:hypothetical protein
VVDPWFVFFSFVYTDTHIHTIAAAFTVRDLHLCQLGQHPATRATCVVGRIRVFTFSFLLLFLILLLLYEQQQQQQEEQQEG